MALIRSRFWMTTTVYSAVVLALVVVSFLTEFTVGPVLYLVAGALTLPMGVLIYPALWVNVLHTGTLTAVLQLGERSSDVLTLGSVAVIFGLAAVANAVVLREIWRARRCGGTGPAAPPE